MTSVVHLGDCLDILRQLPDQSVDAVVTDPPYGLEFMGKDWDRLSDDPVSRSWDTKGRTMTGTPQKNQVSLHRNPNPRCDNCGRAINGRATAKGFKVCECETPAPRYPNTYALKMQKWHEQWGREAFRVLKPGGHALVFGGTRTHHRLAAGLEDAGFEIRDTLAWMYGSGFPKSLDVSKAIDRKRQDRRDWERVGAWLKAQREAAGHTRQMLAPRLSGHSNLDSAAANISNWENGLSFPTWDRWNELRGLLGFGDDMDAEVWRLNGRKGQPGDAWHEREVIGERVTGAAMSGQPSAVTLGTGGTVFGSGQNAVDVTAPATDDARTWQGWGTALKPAYEPITLARKPLQGTVAANVLAHGTGALNIDGCRIEHANDADLATSLGKNPGRDDLVTSDVYGAGRPQQSVNTDGRWPANVTLDPEAAQQLDQQTGDVGGKWGSQGRDDPAPGIYGIDAAGYRNSAERFIGDTGGASRFYYVATKEAEHAEPAGGEHEEQAARLSRGGHPDVAGQDAGGPDVSSLRNMDGAAEDVRFRYVAKTSRAERNAGLDGFEERRAPKMDGGEWHPEGRNVEGTSIALRNHHPTVKPIALMRWLTRLITPPNGVVLDPFTGSGTTGIAAALEGFQFIGIEREPDYHNIAQARIHWWAEHGEAALEEVRKQEQADQQRQELSAMGQLDLFT